MNLPFILAALAVVMGAVGAMTLRNLIHCALSLALAFVGLAAMYLQLAAPFVGFAQILVYVGAVAILILFVILLTRGPDSGIESRFSPGWGWSLGVAVLVFAVLAGILLKGKLPAAAGALEPDITVRQIGDQLMTRYVLPLEVIGLLLTAALIGAVLIAMKDKGEA